MGIDALKELASVAPPQQAKPDEPVSSVGGSTSDQAVEKKQDADYAKGKYCIVVITGCVFLFFIWCALYRTTRNASAEEEEK